MYNFRKYKVKDRKREGDLAACSFGYVFHRLLFHYLKEQMRKNNTCLFFPYTCLATA